MTWRGLVLVAALCVEGCGADPVTAPSPSPTATNTTSPPFMLIESYAAPIHVFEGASLPDYTGSWRGQYELKECRAALPAACKDFVSRKDVRLQISQLGVLLKGTIEFEGAANAFSGTVTDEAGVGGTATTFRSEGSTTSVLIRLTPSNGRFTGDFVMDTHDERGHYMSKRYGVVAPLTKQP